MKRRIVRPTKTCAPCRPVRPKKQDANAPVCGVKPMREYSTICVIRNVAPSRSVSTRPAWRPERLPRLIADSAQWIVKLDVTRMHVLTSATYFGNSYGGGGHSV